MSTAQFNQIEKLLKISIDSAQMMSIAATNTHSNCKIQPQLNAQFAPIEKLETHFAQIEKLLKTSIDLAYMMSLADHKYTTQSKKIK